MSVPRVPTVPALVLAAALLLPACATRVPIASTRPGPVAVGAARHLVILDGQGRRGAREEVSFELARQAGLAGWFTLDDLSGDGHRVQVSGRRVKVRPRVYLEEESAGMRVDVLEWQAAEHSHTVVRAEEDGARKRQTFHRLEGTVVLGVTLFDAWGNVLLAEREYDGTASGPAATSSDEDVIARSAEEAVALFLADVTPQTVVEQVRLDDEDAAQRPILEIVEDGHTAIAARRMEAYAERHPESASAAYNLAVLLDALGERYEALAWYDSALELRYRDFYADARSACARRIADSEALLPPPPPAAYAR